MSHRIFVNTENQSFRDLTDNPKGYRFGLGVPTELSETARVELQQLPKEIYFTADDLRDKRRKLQIYLDTITSPALLGPYSALNIDIIKKYIDEEIYNNFLAETDRRINEYVSAVRQGRNVSYSDLFRAAGQTITSANINSGENVARAVPFGPLLYWRMTLADFPNITSQARRDSSNQRSLSTLYDDQRLIGGFDVSINEALALITYEVFADALFCKKNDTGTQITTPDHPSPGGIGNADRWNEPNKRALVAHFRKFKRVDGAYQNERTYVEALKFTIKYIDLINRILDLTDSTLSRTPDVEQTKIDIPITITIRTALVNLFGALSNTARQVIREKAVTFFDENREYKTLLNLGNDRQYVAEAWRLAPQDSGSVQLKLTTPLDDAVTVDTTAFISRELAETVVDVVSFELPPEQDNTPYLRPFNINNRNQVSSKMLSTGTTLTSLGLVSGSTGVISNSVISYEDTVFRRWFTGDFKSSELNIDFSDYGNFVQFSSAYKRLDAFKEKLKKIEQLTAESSASALSNSTLASLRAREKEYIIRTFDPYEQFLYHAPMSITYSASAFYANNELEYNATGSWPKQSDGNVHSPSSTVATNWFTTQSAIAQRYDENNLNYLILNLPKHIQEDEQSEEFLNLFKMVGHLMDNIKIYIDQFPNIYSTNVDPLKELTMDQVYEVAQSFGLKLPNVYALSNLQELNTQFIGESGSRSYVAETWKRFLHAMVFLSKTKGSRTSFDTLLNAYGISSPVLQIKETTYPTTNNYIQSEELTYGLRFTGSAVNNITVPLVSSSLVGSTIQITFKPIKVQTSSLLTGNSWAVDLIPHPSASKEEYGRIHVVSGSSRIIIASSSYFPLFSDDYTNIMLRSQSGDISIIQTDGDQILFQESASMNLSSLWNITTNFYVGGTGSIKSTNNFDGIVDEIRVWKENISNDNFVAQAYDPGSYYGTNYTSSYVNLYVHVPFSQPLAAITQSVRNESPYQNVSIIQTLPALGFTTASYTKVLRGIKQFTPIVGSTIYTNKKVIVAPPPVFDRYSTDENGTSTLRRTTSIKRVEDKQYNSGQNIISFAVSPTDFINQNIIRSMGVVNVNNIIGSPRFISGSFYSNLRTIQRDYSKYFSKTVNPNQYIRFFKDLIEGPSEMATEMTPARGKLLDGIVIESPVLWRNKNTATRTISVDGSNTKKLIAFVSGSGSAAGIGAYDFTKIKDNVSLLPSSSGETLPIEGTITGSVEMVSSTRPSKLRSVKLFKQKVSDATLYNSSYVTSSILDDKSSYGSIETVISRLPDSSYGEWIDEIPPRADFDDIAVVTYFHKPVTIYGYDLYTKYKQNYYVKIETESSELTDILYADASLRDVTTAPIKNVGRNTATISSATYGVGQTSTGTVLLDSLFSLYTISGSAGLRVRLYNDVGKRSDDIDRDFIDVPSNDAGVLFDGILDGTNSIVFPYTLINGGGGTMYYTIDNTTAGNITTSITFIYFSYEIPNAGIGYLTKHYKYSRDNGTALKRRNYLGCQSTSTTFGVDAPFVVTVAGGNTIVVNTSTNDPNIGGITFGGGGKLSVD